MSSVLLTVTEPEILTASVVADPSALAGGCTLMTQLPSPLLHSPESTSSE